MELLKRERDEGGGRAPRLAWAAVLLTAAGCAVLDAFEGGGEEGSDFPHRVHVVDEEMDCEMCHPGALEEEQAGMPPASLCLLCHEESDEDTPPDERIERFFAGEEVAAGHHTELAEETRFSHAVHAEAELECSSCHVGVGDSARMDADQRVTMADCTSCHEAANAPNECATCHSVIGRGWSPESHDHAWMEVHGRVARADTGALVDSCELCHQESSCLACHQDMRPRNHTAFWRREAHGLAAQIDRMSCATCHRPDYCQRCHDEVIPRSHTGSWGNPLNTHCFSCHRPLAESGCVTCHRGTPSHDMAPMLPPDHSPGMNCRQCHGLTAPLPHVDNGDDCMICHRG